MLNEIFLEQSIWIWKCVHWVDDVIASQMSMYLYIYIFCCCCSNMQKRVPISKYIRANIILHLFRVDIMKVLLSHSWNMGFRHFCEQNTWKIVRRWHHHSFAYSYSYYRLFKKCFFENYENSNFISSLFVIRFTSIFHFSGRNFLLFLLAWTGLSSERGFVWIYSFLFQNKRLQILQYVKKVTWNRKWRMNTAILPWGPIKYYTKSMYNNVVINAGGGGGSSTLCFRFFK